MGRLEREGVNTREVVEIKMSRFSLTKRFISKREGVAVAM